MATKRRNKKDKQLEFLEEALIHNGEAAKQPKKKFTLHDLKSIRPVSSGQEMMFHSYFSGKHIVANGSAGTGKSYSALYLALTDILSSESKQNKIILVRSAVPTRELGHLPGDITEKLAVYEDPYKDIMGDLLRKHTAYDDLKELGKLSFMSTSFIRGLTWDNSVVIMDEVQSMTFHEINSVITRLGKNTKLIICGDINQNDLNTKKNDLSGFDKMLSVCSRMDEFDIINFTRNDICRSAFVKSWICACEDNG